METRILELEERYRQQAETIQKLTDDLIERTAELTDAQAVRDYWLKAYRDRISARRYRYADQIAEVLLKVAHPFRANSPGVTSEPSIQS